MEVRDMENIEYVAKYFGKTVEECEKYAQDGIEEEWSRWVSKPRKTGKQCKEFYKHDSFQVYRNPWYRKPFRWEWFTQHINTTDKVLDYGCGTGEVLERFIEKPNRPEITLADVKSETFTFVKWKYGDKAKYLLIENDRPLKEKYDWIICLDVLEHIPKPCPIFKHLLKHVKPKGNLISWYEPGGSTGHVMESVLKNRPKVYYLLMRKADLKMHYLVKFPSGGIGIKAEWWVLRD